MHLQIKFYHLSYNKLTGLRTLFLFCFCCILFPFLKAQTLRTPVAAIYTQLNTYSNNFNDAFSFTGNQAALASATSFSVGAYGEKRFMLQELGLYKLAFALPTSSGNFGIKGDYFGSAAYNESQLGLAYGRRLGKLDVGAQFNYYLIKASGYGNASSVNFEGGAILHVTDQFQAGVHIYNPTRTGIGKNNGEKLPAIYSAGFGYDASEKLFIGAEIKKTENQPVNVNAGLQYSFDEKFFARTGMGSSTSSFYFGLGFLMNGFRIDATASLHPNLGVTPGIMLLYNAPTAK